MVQGNTPRSPPPAATTSSSSGGIELPSSPLGFQELYSMRSRARRSSMVSTCSLASDSSLDRELDFGMTVCITLQVERMLQVRHHFYSLSLSLSVLAFQSPVNVTGVRV